MTGTVALRTSERHSLGLDGWTPDPKIRTTCAELADVAAQGLQVLEEDGEVRRLLPGLEDNSQVAHLHPHAVYLESQRCSWKRTQN